MNVDENHSWKREIARVVGSIEQVEFTLAKVYEFEDELAGLFPGNKHIRPKIRQQLQVLRDEGLLEFVDNKGRFRKLFSSPEEKAALEEIKEQVEKRNFRVEDSWGLVKKRVGSAYFRKQVLSNFDHNCCVCRLDLEPLLEAAHIIRWAEDPGNRLNPGNGLSLCSLHHKAFDLEFLGVDQELVINVPEDVLESENEAVRTFIGSFDGRNIMEPRTYELLL